MNQSMLGVYAQSLVIYCPTYTQMPIYLLSWLLPVLIFSIHHPPHCLFTFHHVSSALPAIPHLGCVQNPSLVHSFTTSYNRHYTVYSVVSSELILYTYLSSFSKPLSYNPGVHGWSVTIYSIM